MRIYARSPRKADCHASMAQKDGDDAELRAGLGALVRDNDVPTSGDT